MDTWKKDVECEVDERNWKSTSTSGMFDTADEDVLFKNVVALLNSDERLDLETLQKSTILAFEKLEDKPTALLLRNCFDLFVEEANRRSDYSLSMLNFLRRFLHGVGGHWDEIHDFPRFLQRLIDLSEDSCNVVNFIVELGSYGCFASLADSDTDAVVVSLTRRLMRIPRDCPYNALMGFYGFLELLVLSRHTFEGSLSTLTVFTSLAVAFEGPLTCKVMRILFYDEKLSIPTLAALIHNLRGVCEGVAPSDLAVIYRGLFFFSGWALWGAAAVPAFRPHWSVGLQTMQMFTQNLLSSCHTSKIRMGQDVLGVYIELAMSIQRLIRKHGRAIVTEWPRILSLLSLLLSVLPTSPQRVQGMHSRSTEKMNVEIDERRETDGHRESVNNPRGDADDARKEAKGASIGMGADADLLSLLCADDHPASPEDLQRFKKCCIASVEDIISLAESESGHLSFHSDESIWSEEVLAFIDVHEEVLPTHVQHWALQRHLSTAKYYDANWVDAIAPRVGCYLRRLATKRYNVAEKVAREKEAAEAAAAATYDAYTQELDRSVHRKPHHSKGFTKMQKSFSLQGIGMTKSRSETDFQSIVHNQLLRRNTETFGGKKEKEKSSSRKTGRRSIDAYTKGSSDGTTLRNWRSDYVDRDDRMLIYLLTFLRSMFSSVLTPLDSLAKVAGELVFANMPLLLCGSADNVLRESLALLREVLMMHVELPMESQEALRQIMDIALKIPDEDAQVVAVVHLLSLLLMEPASAFNLTLPFLFNNPFPGIPPNVFNGHQNTRSVLPRKFVGLILETITKVVRGKARSADAVSMCLVCISRFSSHSSSYEDAQGHCSYRQHLSIDNLISYSSELPLQLREMTRKIVYTEVPIACTSSGTGIHGSCYLKDDVESFDCRHMLRVLMKQYRLLRQPPSTLPLARRMQTIPSIMRKASGLDFSETGNFVFIRVDHIFLLTILLFVSGDAHSVSTCTGGLDLKALQQFAWEHVETHFEWSMSSSRSSPGSLSPTEDKPGHGMLVEWVAVHAQTATVTWALDQGIASLVTKPIAGVDQQSVSACRVAHVNELATVLRLASVADTLLISLTGQGSNLYDRLDKLHSYIAKKVDDYKNSLDDVESIADSERADRVNAIESDAFKDSDGSNDNSSRGSEKSESRSSQLHSSDEACHDEEDDDDDDDDGINSGGKCARGPRGASARDSIRAKLVNVSRRSADLMVVCGQDFATLMQQCMMPLLAHLQTFAALNESNCVDGTMKILRICARAGHDLAEAFLVDFSSLSVHSHEMKLAAVLVPPFCELLGRGSMLLMKLAKAVYFTRAIASKERIQAIFENLRMLLRVHDHVWEFCRMYEQLFSVSDSFKAMAMEGSTESDDAKKLLDTESLTFLSMSEIMLLKASAILCLNDIPLAKHIRTTLAYDAASFRVGALRFLLPSMSTAANVNVSTHIKAPNSATPNAMSSGLPSMHLYDLTCLSSPDLEAEWEACDSSMSRFWLHNGRLIEIRLVLPTSFSDSFNIDCPGRDGNAPASAEDCFLSYAILCTRSSIGRHLWKIDLRSLCPQVSNTSLPKWKWQYGLPKERAEDSPTFMSPDVTFEGESSAENSDSPLVKLIDTASKSPPRERGGYLSPVRAVLPLRRPLSTTLPIPVQESATNENELPLSPILHQFRSVGSAEDTTKSFLQSPPTNADETWSAVSKGLMEPLKGANSHSFSDENDIMRSADSEDRDGDVPASARSSLCGARVIYAPLRRCQSLSPKLQRGQSHSDGNLYENSQPLVHTSMRKKSLSFGWFHQFDDAGVGKLGNEMELAPQRRMQEEAALREREQHAARQVFHSWYDNVVQTVMFSLYGPPVGLPSESRRSSGDMQSHAGESPHEESSPLSTGRSLSDISPVSFFKSNFLDGSVLFSMKGLVPLRYIEEDGKEGPVGPLQSSSSSLSSHPPTPRTIERSTRSLSGHGDTSSGSAGSCSAGFGQASKLSLRVLERNIVLLDGLLPICTHKIGLLFKPSRFASDTDILGCEGVSKHFTHFIGHVGSLEPVRNLPYAGGLDNQPPYPDGEYVLVSRDAVSLAVYHVPALMIRPSDHRCGESQSSFTEADCQDMTAGEISARVRQLLPNSSVSKQSKAFSRKRHVGNDWIQILYFDATDCSSHDGGDSDPGRDAEAHGDEDNPFAKSAFCKIVILVTHVATLRRHHHRTAAHTQSTDEVCDDAEKDGGQGADDSDSLYRVEVRVRPTAPPMVKSLATLKFLTLAETAMFVRDTAMVGDTCCRVAFALQTGRLEEARAPWVRRMDILESLAQKVS